MNRLAVLLASLLLAVAAHAAEPVKIGITTILSGPFADRGQSEQYGAQLALNRINQSGGVLGRPVEAFYADNACKPETGVPATRRLIEQEHVSVLIGALCTPVTHAIQPLVLTARVPLIIATSAGQDFVDASGVGGNDYLFKTIPSELDIARGLGRYLKTRNVRSLALVGEAGAFPQANTTAMARAAKELGMTVTVRETLAKDTDLAAVMATLKAGSPEAIWVMPGGATTAFFKAYETAGLKIPVTGRYELQAALDAVTPAFRAAGGLENATSVAVFTPLIDRPGVKQFVAAYQAHYGLMPTQRSFFVYEATLLAVDAIWRAHSDNPAAIQKALKTTKMVSLLGGTYATDDHNHAHTPLFIIGLKAEKPAVIATE